MLFDEPWLNDRALAQELVRRLNRLIDQSEPARKALELLCHSRVGPIEGIGPHPTIQVWEDETVTFLGMINGLVGTIPGGRREGWGHIAAIFEEGPSDLVRFEVVEL